jgi:hypothetical protein
MRDDFDQPVSRGPENSDRPQADEKRKFSAQKHCQISRVFALPGLC